MSPRFVRMSWAAFCAAAFLLARISAYGYALEGAKWYDSPLNMALQFPPPPMVLTDGSVSYYRSFENALALWNEQLAGFQFTWAEVPGESISNHDGRTEVSMQTSIYGGSWGSGVLAVTLLNYVGKQSTSSPARMTEADIIFNANRTFNSYRIGDGDGYDFHRVALHELGHVLGLDHPDQSHPEVGYVKPSDSYLRQHLAIMFANVSGVDLLLADDIAGAQSLYGAAPNAPDRSVGHGRVANISTRVNVGTAAHVMIGGFIIQDAAKPVLVRAIGPSLPVSGALADPVLELHNEHGDIIATNDNWQDDAAQKQAISGTGVAPTNASESAIYINLAPGAYTAVVSGKNGTSGVGLFEVYDLAFSSGKIANISTRGEVGTGDNVLIGGFILHGPQANRVVVRAIGPSLAGSIPDALPDTTLELRNSNGELLKSNNNWHDDPTAATVISNSGLGPQNALESAVISYLAPGNFTAIVRGLNDATGVGLVEVYDLQIQ